MSEIELKFQIPARTCQQLHDDLQQQQPDLVHLVAKYYDTPKQDLAKAKVSLRQRLEGERWKQTLKASHPHSLERFELELELSQPPEYVDLAVYKEHPKAQQHLQRALAHSNSPLYLQFQTDVQRSYVVKTFKKSKIEIALDHGNISTKKRQVEIAEIEFELKQGNTADLIAFIQPWVKKYGLYLDIYSKAQRGQLLKKKRQIPAAQYQSALKLQAKMSPDAALKAIINHALMHLLPNSSAIANNQYAAEHVHQARVAIRRLRSALKSFATWLSDVQPEWQSHLGDIFRLLGETRDRDALEASLIPQLQRAGAPLAQLPPARTPLLELSSVFQCTPTVSLLLDLWAFSQSPSPDSSTRLINSTRKHLLKLHQKICQEAEHFLSLPDEDKHRLRKRVKQLRYAVEFSQSLFPSKAIKTYLTALKPVQAALGEFNDLVVAESLFTAAVADEPKYWFALGWIQAQQQQHLHQAQQHLMEFSKIQLLA